MERFESRLATLEPRLRELIGRIPLLPAPPLPPEWLRCEMVERFLILGRAPSLSGQNVVEVGAGGHALSTVPLAALVGPAGKVVAVERSRWTHFRSVVDASALGDRIWPVACDAGRLPLRADGADLAVCLHGIRSLRGDDNIVQIVREMLRVAPRILLAESLPVARTDAQRAHLAMYDLREEVFAAAYGSADDLPYRTLEQLGTLVRRARGVVEKTEVLEVDLPHYLAFFPRAAVEAIPREDRRNGLLRRWDEADRLIRQYGEDHPPVGLLLATRG